MLVMRSVARVAPNAKIADGPAYDRALRATARAQSFTALAASHDSAASCLPTRCLASEEAGLRVGCLTRATHRYSDTRQPVMTRPEWLGWFLKP